MHTDILFSPSTVFAIERLKKNMPPVKMTWECTHIHIPKAAYSSSNNSLFIWGWGSPCSPEALHPNPRKTAHWHALVFTILSSIYTHPSSVPLRLVNQSRILPAVLSQTSICSLWDVDSTALLFYLVSCFPTWMPCFITGTTAYQNCTLVEEMHYPITRYHPLFACLLYCLLQFLFFAESQGRWNGGHREVVEATGINKLSD